LHCWVHTSEGKNSSGLLHCFCSDPLYNRSLPMNKDGHKDTASFICLSYQAIRHIVDPLSSFILHSRTLHFKPCLCDLAQ
jgi:hypothetical protein